MGAAVSRSGRTAPWHHGRNGRRWGRLGSVITGICVVAHLAAVHTSAVHGGLISTAFAAGMAALCLSCAGQLWRSPDPPAWRMTALMAAVMLTLHPLLRPGHAHGGAGAGGTAAAVLLLVAGGIVVLRGPGTRAERFTGGRPWHLRRGEI